MNKNLRKMAVLFSLVFTLVLTGGVAVSADTTDEANDGISTFSNLWDEGLHEDSVED